MPFQEELDKAERAVQIINHKLFAWRPNDRRIADPYVQTAKQAIENIKATRAAYDAKRQGFGSAERQIGNNIAMLKDMNAELDRILHEAKIIPGPVPKGRPEAVSHFSDDGDDSSVDGGGAGGKGMKGIVREGKKVFQKVKKRLSFKGEVAGGGGWGRGGGQEEKVVHRLTLQKDFNDPDRYSRVDWTDPPGSRSRSHRESSSGPAAGRGRPSSSRSQWGAVQGAEAERKAGKKEEKEAKSERKRRHTLESSTPLALNTHGDYYSNSLTDKYNGGKSAGSSSSSSMPIPRPLDGRPPKVSAATGPNPKFPPPADNTYRRRGGSLGGYPRRPLLDPNIRPPSRSSPTSPPFSSGTSTSSASSAKLSMISARTEALFGRHLQQSSFHSSPSSPSRPSSSRSTRNFGEEEPRVRPSVALASSVSQEHPRDSSHGLVYTPIPMIAPLVIRKKEGNVPPLATISEEPVGERDYSHFSDDSDAGDCDGDSCTDTIVTDEFSFSDEVFDTHAAGVLEALDRMSGPGIHFDRLRGYDGNSD